MGVPLSKSGEGNFGGGQNRECGKTFCGMEGKIMASIEETQGAVDGFVLSEAEEG